MVTPKNHRPILAVESPVPGPAPARPDGEEWPLVDLHRHWRTVVKHRTLILFVTGATFALTALVNLSSRNLYVASTQIRIDPAPPVFLNLKDAAPPVADQSYYETEYAILGSTALATRVITALRLYDDPRFPASYAAAGADQTRELVQHYLEALSVTATQNSRLVTISYASSSPELAAEISRAHAHEFIRMTLEARTDLNTEAQRFLETKLDQFKRRTEQSEAALNDFQRAHPELAAERAANGNVVAETMKTLTASYTRAQAERIALKADYALVTSRDYGALAAVQRDPVYNALLKEFQNLRSEYERRAQVYKPKYPEMVELAASIDGVVARMNEQVEGAVAAVESQYLAAKEKEKALAAALERQRQATIDANDATVQFELLSREVDTHRELYNKLFSRAKEIEIAESLNRSNVTIVSLAEVPDTPAVGQLKRNLTHGLLLGLCLALLAAFGFEHVDSTAKTPEDVEALLHLPVLAVVPSIAGGPRRLADRWRRPQRPPPGPEAAVLLKGEPTAASAAGQATDSQRWSLFVEAFRTLRTTVLLVGANRPLRVIQISSAQGGEGKTIVTVNTAVTLARAGARVLVIDADLYRPRCHRLLQAARVPGLIDVLTARAPFERCMQTVPAATAAAGNAGMGAALAKGRLDFVPVGTAPPVPLAILGSPRMREMLQATREAYDFVLIDSPPLLAVSDGLLLATMVDGVLLVIRGESTPCPVVKQAIARLGRAGARIVGAVLNDVDLAASRSYYGARYSGAEEPYGDEEVA